MPGGAEGVHVLLVKIVDRMQTGPKTKGNYDYARRHKKSVRREKGKAGMMWERKLDKMRKAVGRVSGQRSVCKRVLVYGGITAVGCEKRGEGMAAPISETLYLHD